MSNDQLYAWSLGIGIAAAAIAILCLGYFAFWSSASRNIGLGTGALAGAIVIFLLQLAFELQSSEESGFFSVEYTIDRAAPSIRQWDYGRTNLNRAVPEIRASEAFAAENVGQFDGDGAALVRDLAIFSLVSYLGAEQFDWQINRVQFKTPSGTLTRTGYRSKPRDCTTFDAGQLKALLAGARNSFAKASPLMLPKLCMPPDTRIAISPGRLRLANRYCDIDFEVQDAGSIGYRRPGTQEVPTLPNKDPQFETRPIGINATIRFSWVRAQHRRMKQYRDWAEGLVAGADQWFSEKLVENPATKAH